MMIDLANGPMSDLIMFELMTKPPPFYGRAVPVLCQWNVEHLGRF
jgi:hypothetical protein